LVWSPKVDIFVAEQIATQSDSWLSAKAVTGEERQFVKQSLELFYPKLVELQVGTQT